LGKRLDGGSVLLYNTRLHTKKELHTMRKITAKNKTAIIQLMFKTTADYINTFCIEDIDAFNASMYIGDIAYNTNALNNFIKDNNALNLHNAIMQQDTIVREFYYTTLKYIEDNNLIPLNMFTCIK
jgi:hypothetical protein